MFPHYDFSICYGDSHLNWDCTTPTIHLFYGVTGGNNPGLYFEADAIDVADLNKDGHLDLLIASRAGARGGDRPQVELCMGLGSRQFDCSLTFNNKRFQTSENGLKLPDLNNDQILDAVVANCADMSTNELRNRVFVYLGEDESTDEPGNACNEAEATVCLCVPANMSNLNMSAFLAAV